MERFQQHKRSFSREKSYQGNVQSRKRVDVSKLASDSRSCSSHLTEEDLFPIELRQSRSKQTAEASIKKLLAEEMEARRRPPSVIAKLMGLDALPPPPPIKKQQKKFSENYLQKTASIGSLEKSPSYESRSLRMINKEQQEFKDVYEVLEPAKIEKHPNLLAQKGTANSKRSDAKMEFVRQKFMDVKRLSTNEKFQHSKEFHDALEVLDSNKDLLLKFLQEPDSLFTKHLHDLEGVPPPPQPGHITVLKSSHAGGNISRKSDRKIERSEVDDYLQKPGVGIVSHTQNKHGVHSSSKVPKSHVGEKDETCLVPTRIVVLKPNLRKAQNIERHVSSPGSLGRHPSGYRERRDFQSPENLELFAEVRDRRSSPIELEVLKHRNRGSREIAKEITRQMRHSVNSQRVSSSRLKGYAGDESSDSVSGNDSANESELMTPTSRHFYDWKNRYSPSSSYSNESSVSREAKKRLSERWKMTRKFQEVRKVGRGSTLGEMLALPDRETKSTTLDSVGAQDGFTDIVVRNGASTRCGSPLGISSRDGWKDECARSLARSRSLPASSTVFGSPKMSTRRGVHVSDRFFMQKDAVNRGSSKSNNEDSEQTLGFFSRGSSTRSRGKKSQSFSFVGKEKSDTGSEAHLKPDEPSINLEMEVLSDKKPRSLEVPDYEAKEAIHVRDEAVVSKPWDKMIPYESSQEQLSGGTSCIMSANDGDTSSYCITSANDGDTFSYNLDQTNSEMMGESPSEETSIVSHSCVTEVESPASSKEAGQPSPVSVLEPPFVEEPVSGSDSFETVSADLHGLRMQLQLLKMESSDAYSEGFEMMVSSDEDAEEGSVSLCKENGEANRDFLYVAAVLVDSGIQDADMDVLLTTWYSPEGFVSTDVFEKLEKKYREDTTWPRHERRLLFDQIKSGLMEILEPHMDPHPWVKLGKRTRRGLGGPLTEELWNVLVNNGKEESKDPLEKILGKGLKWLDLGDDIDAVGREIERLVFEELVTELW